MDTDDRYAPRPLAGWFKPAAIASILWFLLGCGLYLYEVTLDPASLPLDMRMMMEALPTWMWAAFAVAVWIGLAGTVLLLLRKRLAVPLLGVSLLASVVQNSAYVLDRRLSEVTGSDQLLLPIIIVAVNWTIFWFAYYSQRRGWLR